MTIRGLVAIALALMSVSVRADAQGVAERDLKAAFLLNFVKFTEWPSLPETSVTVCVVGDAALASALVTTAHAAESGRQVSVATLAADAPFGACRVLFIGESGTPPLPAIFEQAATLRVLTVSDRPRFAESGGAIGLYRDGGRMRFAVNVDAVQRARLRLSSRLLGLATIVRERHAQ
jgi:hypothetical protein